MLFSLVAFMPGLAGRSADPEPPRDNFSQVFGAIWILGSALCGAVLYGAVFL